MAKKTRPKAVRILPGPEGWYAAWLPVGQGVLVVARHPCPATCADMCRAGGYLPDEDWETKRLPVAPVPSSPEPEPEPLPIPKPEPRPTKKKAKKTKPKKNLFDL